MSIYLLTCLFVYLSICLSTCLSVCRLLYLPTCLPSYPSIHLVSYLSIFLSSQASQDHRLCGSFSGPDCLESGVLRVHISGPANSCSSRCSPGILAATCALAVRKVVAIFPARYPLPSQYKRYAAELHWAVEWHTFWLFWFSGSFCIAMQPNRYVYMYGFFSRGYSTA